MVFLGMTSAALDLGAERVFKQRVWNWVLLVGTIAIVASIGGLFAWRRNPASLVSLAIGPLVMVTAIGTGIYARRALRPFEPQLAALNEFVPPPSARHAFTSTRAPGRPLASRTWGFSGTRDSACAAAQKALEAWADPATVTQATRPLSDCEFSARRNGNEATLDVTIVPFPRPDEPLAATLTLTVTAP